MITKFSSTCAHVKPEDFGSLHVFSKNMPFCCFLKDFAYSQDSQMMEDSKVIGLRFLRGQGS